MRKFKKITKNELVKKDLKPLVKKKHDYILTRNYRYDINTDRIMADRVFHEWLQQEFYKRSIDIKT